MNKEEKHLDWMKHKYKWHCVGDIIMLPIIISLWYLGYENGFWVVLVLYVINEFCFAATMKTLSRLAGLKDY
jgi:hypothetical protein